jgi:hypothetical protein
MSDTKTVAEMVAELRACDSEYVTYGSSDLGIPVLRVDAIQDILNMEDEQIGPGTWYACDSFGLIPH